MNKWIIRTIVLAVLVLTIPGAASAQTISSHTGHTLVLTEDGVVTFGKNTFSQLGDGTDEHRYSPVPVLNLPSENFISVEAGAKHSFARTDDGRVFGWGSNHSGELGTSEDGELPEKPAPVLSYEQNGDHFRKTPLTDVTSIAAGSDHTIAVREDGSLWSWGRNDHHQLGQHSYIPTGTKYIAQRIESDKTFTKVVSYENHNFVLDEEGGVWGFGQNITRMFQTSESRVKKLQRIEGLPPIKQIETGNSHALALDSKGGVWTWGYNYFGQNSDVPSAVEGLPPISSIATGDTHNLALSENGSVYGWGENNYGELTGKEELIETPTEIMPSSASIEEIEGGKNYSIAKTTEGDLYTWGRNDYGQLGDGSGRHQNSPVFISMQEVEEVIIDENRLSLQKGETYQINATVLPENARNKTLRWSSSNTDVATVEDGLITAVGNDSTSREATITATSANGKHSDSVRVTLRVPVTGVDIVKNALILERTWTYDGLSDETYQLEANVYPYSASDKRLIWTTSDPDVVTVDPQGTLHSQKTGKATVTATTIDGGHTDTIPITVTIPVNEIHIRGAAGGMQLWEGQTEQLDYFVYPVNASNQDVLDWSSSDPDVVSVDYYGNVTARSPGTATVTVTSIDKRKQGKITINVKEGQPVNLSGFSITEESISLAAREEQKIKTVFYPENASDKRVEWTSADERIAKVDSEGNVRGIASGTTTVTAVTKDGNFERKIEVNIGATNAGWVIFPERNGVPRDKTWTIEFTTPLSPETVTEENVFIQDIRGNVISSNVNLDEKTITITPKQELAEESYYYLIVNDKVHSASDTPLKNNVHFLFQTE